MSRIARAALILLCLGAGFLGWRAVKAVGDGREAFARLAAERADRERRTAACLAVVARRSPELDAQADVRRGVRVPIILYAGDDVGAFLAPGIGQCASSGPPDVRRVFTSRCEAGFGGPGPILHTYAARYNRRLVALAPGAGAACRQPLR